MLFFVSCMSFLFHNMVFGYDNIGTKIINIISHFMDVWMSRIYLLKTVYKSV